ncbi:MAG: hypothetical protein RMY62_018460, partial [Nostoc sp. ZfuVER08]|nr:hypothetical protein [Nostoc sp. ZfuVER08]
MAFVEIEFLILKQSVNTIFTKRRRESYFFYRVQPLRKGRTAVRPYKLLDKSAKVLFALLRSKGCIFIGERENTKPFPLSLSPFPDF